MLFNLAHFLNKLFKNSVFLKFFDEFVLTWFIINLDGFFSSCTVKKLIILMVQFYQVFVCNVMYFIKN